MDKYEACCALFDGFDWSHWTTGMPAEKLSLLANAQEHILRQENGKERLFKAVKELSERLCPGRAPPEGHEHPG